MAEKKRVVSPKLQQWRSTSVSPITVQKILEEALERYGFADWRVVPSPDIDATTVVMNSCEVRLPTNGRFTAASVVELLAEEIETHVLRAVSGKRSKIALLGSGTRGYLPTEEGLAKVAIQETMAAHGLEKNFTWVSTLALGLASGVFAPPQSFRTLFGFFKTVFLINNLQSEQQRSIHDAEKKAWQDALARVSRTFWGITDLEVPGVCNLKDGVYLQGYREVREQIETTPIERLYVGSISTKDLPAMEDWRC